MEKPKKLSTVSNVPYSLSDIQLPDSPGKCLVKSVSKSLDVKKVTHTKKYRSRFDVTVRDVADTHDVPSNGVSSTGDVKEEKEPQDTESNIEHLTNTEEYKSSKRDEQKKMDIEEKENIENVVSSDCDSKFSPGKNIANEDVADVANITQSSSETQSKTEPETTEPKTKIEVTESETKIEVTESETKAEVTESEIKVEVTESETKVEVAESETKVEVTSETKVEVTSETKVEVAESETKAEIESEAKLEVAESKTKAEVAESETKAEVVESKTKTKVTEYETKTKVTESETKVKVTHSETKVEVTESETKVEVTESAADMETDTDEKEPDSPDDNEKSSESDDQEKSSRSRRRVDRKRSKSESSDSTSQSSESSVERSTAQIKDSESHSQDSNETKESEALSLDVPEKIETEETLPVPKPITFRRLKIKRSNIVNQQKPIMEEVPKSNAKQEKESPIAMLEMSEAQTAVSEKQTDAPKKQPETFEKEPVTDEPQSEETANVPQKPVELPVLTSRKLSISTRKLNRKSLTEEDKSEETCQKKSRWGNYSSNLQRSSISISTNSLKNLIPDFKLITGPLSSNDTEDILNQDISGDSSPTKDVPSNTAAENETVHDDIKDETSKTIYKQLPSLEKEHEPKQQHTAKCPSPQTPVSKIIFVRNLVRPFTLLQLKELLRQTGNIVEESFWIDKIKSKCYVEYETEEEAVNTRLAVNGTRWPSSNPKILFVEYATQEELDSLRGGSVSEVAPIQSQKVPAIPEVRETRTVLPTEEHKKKERERRKEKSKPYHPVREWDKDKISQESPEREHISKEVEKVKSLEKKEKKESKKRPTEDTPAKLLDDLFKKTKASPCIYWLPLTEEQVKQRKVKEEEEKKQRVIEREKRNQLREQEEAERRNRKPRPAQRSHERETRRTPNRSRSPVVRRR